MGWSREERKLSVNSGKEKRSKIFTSLVDPDFECVPIESQTPNGRVAEHPPGSAQRSGRLCPEGFVPRRKRRRYTLDGKVIIDPESTPERNPSSENELESA